MIVPLSSNVISGAYSVLEMVLIVVLARLITSIAGTLNVKAIYEERRKLSLTNSKISAISDPGLTVHRIHFIAALISIIATVLLTVGQFGIVGVTEIEYEEVTVKYLVNKAPTDYVLNVQDHISVERKMVSTEILILRLTSDCELRTTSHVEKYAFIYEGDDLEELSDIHRHFNVTCVANDFGFEKKVAHVFSTNSSIYNVTMPTQCDFSVNESEIPFGKVTKASVETNCSWTVREAWCYREKRLYCTAVWEYSGFNFLVTRGYDLESRITRYLPLVRGEEFETERLKTGALLMAMELVIHPSTLFFVLSSWVERNATVRKIINPSRQATRIHVPLLRATLVPSVLIVLFTTCAALYVWRKVIFIPGRHGYNRFNSAAELLSCAAVEKFGDGGCRYVRSGGINVGLDECGEHAGPIKLNGDHVESECRRHSGSF